MFFSEDAKTVQTCLISLSTVCEGNFAYGMSKTSVQDEVANCTGKLLQGTQQNLTVTNRRIWLNRNGSGIRCYSTLVKQTEVVSNFQFKISL